MDAGRLDKRAAFTRRPYVEGSTTQRGDEFSDGYLTVWASYVRLSANAKVQAGAEIDDEVATLTVRDSSRSREITAEDRVTVLGRDFQVVNVGLPNRSTGMIAMTISSDLS